MADPARCRAFDGKPRSEGKEGGVGSSYITAVRHLDLAPQIEILRSFQAEIRA